MPLKKKAKQKKELKGKSKEIEVIDSSDYRRRNPEKNTLGQAELERLVSSEQKSDLIVEKVLYGLPESYSVLLLANPESYSAVKSAILRKLSGEKGIYIAANSPFSSLQEEISKYSLKCDDIFFIDLVSKMTNAKTPAEKNVYYLESANNLTELMVLIEKTLSPSGSSHFIVFDSISTLLVYNDPKAVEKLIHVLVGQANSYSAKLILLMVNSREQEGTIETIGQFCTKVAKIDRAEI